MAIAPEFYSSDHHLRSTPCFLEWRHWITKAQLSWCVPQSWEGIPKPDTRLCLFRGDIAVSGECAKWWANFLGHLYCISPTPSNSLAFSSPRRATKTTETLFAATVHTHPHHTTHTHMYACASRLIQPNNTKRKSFDFGKFWTKHEV